MTQFFKNNFSEDRWRKAALKNAFSLLGKQRFEQSAAFFLLAGSLKDAIEVLTTNYFSLSNTYSHNLEMFILHPVFISVSSHSNRIVCECVYLLKLIQCNPCCAYRLSRKVGIVQPIYRKTEVWYVIVFFDSHLYVKIKSKYTDKP